ncbi:MFS transporter [Streptomyces clavuligerus]|uniref:Drug resistance transporter, EmrB/QacA subfamily n=1 Tax=Streptomyces clavuligerus TaxID=1901 RepID=E2PXN0_STRCL|nr:MFS transporter [Streptomyces clavuligerus]ANW19132.1 MFS transporter [Streptomyces clavuligerus]AXU13715.1 MFS transporter [Streptomyces clavuligerus]EFG08120.1 Drug resistance transporter, EmrB/QacA subfamily [Streptomyces clavuligerus]MBY6303689.1 MFS transporter [Streptomyces clavuligerus]QCS06501.1 MFS transporter [Streptomyces clavuligerus]
MERHPRRWLILVVLCLSTLVLVIDNMVLTVAIPSIAEDLGATSQDIQWIIDSYILVFAGLLLTAGSLSDKYGRRKVMVVGLVVFGAASVVATCATSPEQLILGRVLMGVGGALVMPSTLSILITVFDEEERPKAIAAWSTVAMVGLVGGPVLGGALLDRFDWGAVFLINVPIALLAIVAALVLMPESKGPWRKADPVGMVLSMAGMTALVWTIIELPHGGLDHTGTRISLAITLLGLIGFGVWETRGTDSPMVPLSLFRNRTFTGASLSLVLLTFANGGLMLVLTQYLQFVLGYTPTETGLAFTPMALAVIVFNAVGASLLARTGNRALAVIGLLVIAGGFALLASLSAGDGRGLLATAMVLLGAGSGLAMPAAISALMGAVPTEHAGVGSALNDTIQQAGAALGVAILGAVLSSTYTDGMAKAPEEARHSISDALALQDGPVAELARSAFTEAMSTSFWAGAAGVIAAAVLATVFMGGRKQEAVPAGGAAAEGAEKGENTLVG